MRGAEPQGDQTSPTIRVEPSAPPWSSTQDRGGQGSCVGGPLRIAGVFQHPWPLLSRCP